MPLVAVNRRHVRSIDPVMFEFLIERPHPHRPHAFCYEITNRILHHRRGNPGFHSKTVGEVRRNVEFASADVNFTFGRFAERDDSWIQAMNQGSKRKKIQSTFRFNL